MSGMASFLNALMPYVSLMITGIPEVIGMVNWGLSKVSTMAEEKREPTDAEWDELNRRIADFRKRLYRTL